MVKTLNQESSPVVKNQHFLGKCTDYTYDGLGVVKYDTFCVFVKDMAVGDEGEIVVTALKKGYAYGRLLKLEKTAEGRNEAVCDISRQCGGCQLQHLSYKEQLRFKEQTVRNDIERIAKIECPVNTIIGAASPLKYRNKCQLPVGTDKEGNTVIGFYRYNSHEIIPFDFCYLQSERVNDLTREIKKIIQEEGLNREVRHIMIREMTSTDEVMVVLVCWHDHVDGIENAAERIVRLDESIKSVIQNINPDETNVVMGRKQKLLYGEWYIHDVLLGLRFNISANSFYQVNSQQTAVLYSKAIELADIKNTDAVLDLYCGVGTIGMVASGKARKVVGVEIVEKAIADAKRNAEANGITNMEFYCNDAKKAAREFADRNEKFDVVIVDPPRKGCDQATLEALLEIAPERIVYVSCNPATLARDLRYLDDNGYKATVIQPVDQFPQTYHVECVVRLEKC